MKKILTLAAILLALSACGSHAQNTKQEMNDSKTLVAWFSWSGNTEAVANHIASKLGAETFRIERVTAYPTDYDQCADEAKGEMESKARPAIKGLPDHFSEYDTVIIAVPVWWYTAPMPVFTFIESLDWKGKTVIPVCTAYTGEYNTLKDIAAVTPDADHKEGFCLVEKGMGGKLSSSQCAKVDVWLERIL